MASNRSAEVETWLERYDNPRKPLVRAVREVILDADPRVTEAIKWQAPTFMFRGNIASFYPRSQSHVALVFHAGASLDDPAGLLEGEGAVSRVARFLDADDLVAKSAALRGLIRSWIADHDD